MPLSREATAPQREDDGWRARIGALRQATDEDLERPTEWWTYGEARVVAATVYAVASARTDESSRLTRTLIVAFAVAATAGLIASPGFAFLTSARPSGPGVPMQERFGIAVSGLHSAFWLLLVAVVLSRLQAQPRWLDVWLAGLAVTVTAYGVSEIAFVWVPEWTRSPDDSTFFVTAYAGISIVRSAAMVGVSAAVAWSMIRWVRRPAGDADADTGELEVVVAELVDGSDG